MVEPFLGVAMSGLAIGVGYLLGRRHERMAQAEAEERLLRLDPPDRRPGLPTNLGVPASKTVQPRVRRGKWMR